MTSLLKVPDLLVFLMGDVVFTLLYDAQQKLLRKEKPEHRSGRSHRHKHPVLIRRPPYALLLLSLTPLRQLMKTN
jgi:hypothetical protein